MWKDELTILYGRGREKFEVSKQILSIGRSPDNDIVLNDSAVSSFHCEIQFLKDGFFVVDKESSNGTWLDNKEINKAEFLPGAKIRVGDTTLIISRKSVPAVRLFGRSFKPLRFAICIAVFILVSAFIFLEQIRNKFLNPVGCVPPNSINDSKNAISSKKVMPDGPAFEMDIVEESGGFEKLVRSQISISGCILRFYFDDLGRKRHIYREVELTSEEIDKLGSKIVNSGFFEISAANHSNFEGESFLTINAKLDSFERKISFSENLPEGIASFKDELLFFITEKFDFPSLELSGEELVKKAEKAFEQGKLFYSQRKRRSDSLFNSVNAFKSALWYVETVESKPSFLSTVREYLYMSEEKLDNEFKKLRFQAEKAMRFLKWHEARDNFEKIAAKIPDRTDERYKYAIRHLQKVKKKCR